MRARQDGPNAEPGKHEGHQGHGIIASWSATTPAWTCGGIFRRRLDSLRFYPTIPIHGEYGPSSWRSTYRGVPGLSATGSAPVLSSGFLPRTTDFQPSFTRMARRACPGRFP